MRRLAKARSPGKLILSGEHSVVYGKPALAMATHFYTESSVEQALSPQIGFRLPELQYAKQLTKATLQKLKNRVKKDYSAFLAGECGIRAVLKKPVELLQFTVANVLELGQAMMGAVDVQTHSTIPIGCGMGSSAALVMSTLRAMGQLFDFDWDHETYCRLGLEAERCQHGYASGLDIQLVWQGGCLLFQEGRTERRNIPALGLYAVNTGQPLSTTGDCVQKARVHFTETAIAEDFEAVTRSLDNAFAAADVREIQKGIQENHRLLCHIGVVPPMIAAFIARLEQLGAAAKICGAGAVMGEKAGMLLIVPTTLAPLETVVKAQGWTLERIEGNPYGTQIV